MKIEPAVRSIHLQSATLLRLENRGENALILALKAVLFLIGGAVKPF